MTAATKLLTVPETAAALGVSRRTVYRQIAEGELPVVLVRDRIRISQAAVRAYIRSNTQPAFRRLA